MTFEGYKIIYGSFHGNQNDFCLEMISLLTYWYDQ